MSVPRYRSTGKPAIRETAEDILEAEQRERRESNPAFKRMRSLEAIREDRANRETSRQDQFWDAVKSFDYAHPEIKSNPTLLQRAADLQQERVNKAQAEGRIINDWHSEFRAIGNEVRKAAGYGPLEEQQRAESLSELKKARGQE